MSLNISKKILAVSKVTVETRVDNLSKRQQANLKRMVQTGMISGRSVPSVLARQILESRGLPHISRWYMTSSYVSPKNCPLGSEGHEFIGEMYAKSVLEGNEEYPTKYVFSNVTYCPAQNYLKDPDEEKSIKLLGSVVKWMFENYSFNHEVDIGEVIAMEFGAKDCYRSL